MPDIDLSTLTPRARDPEDKVVVMKDGTPEEMGLIAVGDFAETASLAAIATSGSASDLSAGTVPASRFNDTSHGSRGGGSLHANAIASGAAGFMTGADKAKLDGVASGAQVNVPTDLGYTAATRELTSSTGDDVTLPLATETAPGLARRVENGPTRYYTFDDFTNVAVGNGGISDWVVTNSGTGAGQTQASSHGDVIGIGFVDFNTGTTSIGRSARTLSSASIDVGDGLSIWRGRGKLNELSTGSQRYTLRIGFLDSASAESTDGCFFRYADNVNSGRWQAVARQGGVESAADTGVSAVIDTLSVFQVVIDPTGPSAEFTIDGVSVATITSDIPVDALCGAGVVAIKSVGLTSVAAITMDYQSVEQILTGRP